MSKKISLKSLKVKSFVTSIEENKAETVKGGYKIPMTQVYNGCWSSYCGSDIPYCAPTGRPSCP